MFPLPQWLKSYFYAPRVAMAARATTGPVGSPLNKMGERISGALMAADDPAPKEGDGGGAGTATAEPEAPKGKPKRQMKGASKTKPKRPPAKQLPPWKVLLHNDDKNTFEHVILSLVELTPVDFDRAAQITLEADKQGLALVLVTHKERAELYVDQFKSKSLTVTIEPAE